MTRNQWNVPRGLSSFECGPDVVLFRESTGDLFLLNETAAYVWRELESGARPDAICRSVAASTSASPERVADDIRTLIDDWNRLAAPVHSATRDAFVGHPTQPRAIADGATSSLECAYRLLDFTFKVRTEHRSALEIVTAIFGHLTAEPSTTAAVFDIVRRDRSWRLLGNGQPLGECDSLEGLAPRLHAEILLAAYENLDCLAGLHAAVVVDGERAILMPARSGGGKSTLTAALVAAGYRYGTDDLAILSYPPVRIRPAPVSIGLKDGSWAPLERKLRLLGEQPVHVRADGRRIRYYTPAARQIAPGSESYSAGTILFPRYEPDTALSCEPIRSGEALLRLAQAGYDARLSAPAVAALTGWLGALPAYELRYSDLDQAVSVIGEITR